MPVARRSAPRVVFFDAGNTLLRMNYPVIAHALAERGLHVTPEEVQRAEWRARVRLDEELSRARVSTETGSTAGRYLTLILDALGVTDANLAEAMVAWRLAYNPPVGVWNIAEPRADEALQLVRAAGVGAAVISNSNGSVRSILDALGLGRHLDFVLDSAEVGVEKPDARIFQLALERARVRPSQAVYVGDLYSIDVIGARAAGMGAVLLDPGRCAGQRDCPTALDVLDAVRLLLGA
jgi:putative hydrolase of the HAD superfamily